MKRKYCELSLSRPRITYEDNCFSGTTSSYHTCTEVGLRSTNILLLLSHEMEAQSILLRTSFVFIFIFRLACCSQLASAPHTTYCTCSYYASPKSILLYVCVGSHSTQRQVRCLLLPLFGAKSKWQSRHSAFRPHWPCSVDSGLSPTPKKKATRPSRNKAIKS
jgi:hypothetical protein